MAVIKGPQKRFSFEKIMVFVKKNRFFIIIQIEIDPVTPNTFIYTQ